VFVATRPTSRTIDRFLTDSRTLPFSYQPTGLTQGAATGYKVDEMVVPIGHGAQDFDRAKAALAAWKHFDIGWLQAIPSSPVPEPGTVVAVVIRHFGFWSLNGARVVYVVGDRQSTTRFGFAYGTLVNHAEAGEELFEVFVDPSTEDCCTESAQSPGRGRPSPTSAIRLCECSRLPAGGIREWP